MTMSEHPSSILPVHPPAYCSAVHFNRCIRFKDRAEFLQDTPEPLWQRIEHILSRNRVCSQQHQDASRGRLLGGRGRGEQVLSGRGTESVYKEVNAGMVYFQNGLPYSHPKAVSTFPNRTVLVAELLPPDAGKSLLKEPYKDEIIRQFHLPANNIV